MSLNSHRIPFFGGGGRGGEGGGGGGEKFLRLALCTSQSIIMVEDDSRASLSDTAENRCRSGSRVMFASAAYSILRSEHVQKCKLRARGNETMTVSARTQEGERGVEG